MFLTITESHLSHPLCQFFTFLFSSDFSFWLREQDDHDGLDHLCLWSTCTAASFFVFSLCFCSDTSSPFLFFSSQSNLDCSGITCDTRTRDSYQWRVIPVTWEHLTLTCSSCLVKMKTKSHYCKYLKKVQYQRITVIFIILCATGLWNRHCGL